jgi:hypothetical protein
MLFLALCVLVLFVHNSAAFNSTAWTYDGTQAEKSLWLSSAAYCEPSTYLTRSFSSGPTAGFVATHHIQDTATDTQGFVGYLPSDKSIYVAFRGSTDTRYKNNYLCLKQH